VTVPTASLSALLDKHHIEQIDFLSLDVEGFELSALRGMELERHHPTYLLIEARYRAEVEAYLSTHYEAVADFSHHDVLYRYRGGRR